MSDTNSNAGSIMSADKLTSLEAGFRQKVTKVLNKLKAKGYAMRIVWGKRSQEENNELVLQGLASPNSKHLEGKAIDVVLRKHGYTVNTENQQFWNDLKIEAESEGLTWGGNWNSPKDPGHVEAKN